MLSFLEYKQEVVLVLLEQEENVAFPKEEYIQECRIAGATPSRCALDWYQYCLAHS